MDKEKMKIVLMIAAIIILLSVAIWGVFDYLPQKIGMDSQTALTEEYELKYPQVFDNTLEDFKSWGINSTESRIRIIETTCEREFKYMSNQQRCKVDLLKRLVK